MNKKSKFRKSLILFLLLVLTTSIPLVSSQNSYLEYNETTNTCTVYPTGSDDTINLQEAFNLVTANGKGRVKLVEGEYTVNEEIVVINFDGRFMGAGQGKTILKTTNRDDWQHRDVTYFPEVASVFLFYQDDVEERTIEISDMTVEIHATTDYYDMFFGLNVFDIYGCVDGYITEDETPLNTVFTHVKIIGDTADDWPFVNTVNPLQVGGQPHVDGGDWSFEPIAGTHIVKNCYFDTLGGAVKYNSVNGKIDVKNNVIKDCYGGITLYFCDTVDAPKREIKSNKIYGSGAFPFAGISIWGSNSFEIKHNKIEDGYTGIDVWMSDEILIKGNLIDGNDLDLSWDMDGDITWKNNKYTTKNWS